MTGKRSGGVFRATHFAVLAVLAFAGVAVAHDGPRDGHLVTGDPPGAWHRLLHDCAEDYGQHAGAGLTQTGHGLVNLDVREELAGEEPSLLFYLVLDKQHPLLRDHPTRETIHFETPARDVATVISRTPEGAFVHESGTLASVVGPLVVIDLEDMTGPDDGRYAVEITYRHADLALEAGDKIRAFRVDGETIDATRTSWMLADTMLGGYYDPLLGPALGPNAGCDPEADDDAYEAESFALALGR